MLQITAAKETGSGLQSKAAAAIAAGRRVGFKVPDKNRAVTIAPVAIGPARSSVALFLTLTTVGGPRQRHLCFRGYLNPNPETLYLQPFIYRGLVGLL